MPITIDHAIGLIIGITLQRFFNITKHTANLIKKYQEAQKKKNTPPVPPVEEKK